MRSEISFENAKMVLENTVKISLRHKIEGWPRVKFRHYPIEKKLFFKRFEHVTIFVILISLYAPILSQIPSRQIAQNIK